MGKHNKNAKAKSSETVQDPHYTEFDTQKERNIQPRPNERNRPSHP